MNGVIGYIKQIDAPWVMEIIAERFDYQAIEMMPKHAIIYGGAVRDALAGLPLVGDLDIAVATIDKSLIFQKFQGSVKWTYHKPKEVAAKKGKCKYRNIDPPAENATNCWGDMEWAERVASIEGQERVAPQNRTYMETAERVTEQPETAEEVPEDAEEVTVSPSYTDAASAGIAHAAKVAFERKTRQEVLENDTPSDTPENVTDREEETVQLDNEIVLTNGGAIGPPSSISPTTMFKLHSTRDSELLYEPDLRTPGEPEVTENAENTEPEAGEAVEERGAMCTGIITAFEAEPVEEGEIVIPPDAEHMSPEPEEAYYEDLEVEHVASPSSLPSKRSMSTIRSYKKSTLPLSEIYTFSDVNGAVIQIVVAKSSPITDSRIRREVKSPIEKSPIEHAIYLVRNVDIICCGVIMNNKGEVFEVIEGAYDDCKSRILRFNYEVENDVSIERVVERTNRLKKRGWTDKMDFAEIEKFVKRAEKVKMAKRARAAKKAKSKNGTGFVSGGKMQYKEISKEWKMTKMPQKSRSAFKDLRKKYGHDAKTTLARSDEETREGQTGRSDHQIAGFHRAHTIHLIPGQSVQSTSPEEAQQLFDAAERGNPGRHIMEIYDSPTTRRTTFRIKRKLDQPTDRPTSSSTDHPTRDELDRVIERAITRRSQNGQSS